MIVYHHWCWIGARSDTGAQHLTEVEANTSAAAPVIMEHKASGYAQTACHAQAPGKPGSEQCRPDIHFVPASPENAFWKGRGLDRRLPVW